MSVLPTTALLTLWAFPCIAGMLTEQFSSMDLNKDGFLSEVEFVQGMSRKDDSSSSLKVSESDSAEPVSSAERKKLIDNAVSEAKKILPYKVDDVTTWTDVYGTNDTLHYIYNIDMDLQSLPAGQISELKPVMEAQICPKVQPAMCGIAKTTLLNKGISLLTHYKDKNGNLLAECRFAEKDCP